MAKYQPTYKCPLCCKLITLQTIEMKYEQVMEFSNKIVLNQQMIGNPYLYHVPMFVLHNCDDGSCGLAKFAGFKKE